MLNVFQMFVLYVTSYLSRTCLSSAVFSFSLIRIATFTSSTLKFRMEEYKEYKPKYSRPHRVCILGSGNWGSTVAKMIGTNVKKFPETFEPTVNVWVYDETIDGERLTEIINAKHVNVKYLPGVKLPENVIAIPEVGDAVKGATILVFVMPHQFLKGICASLKGTIAHSAIAISLIKGVFATETHMQLISEVIAEMLQIRCSVLMGANIANEVAAEHFSETTIASRNVDDARLLKRLLETDYFRVTISNEIAGVELCGALKNIVAVAAGVVDGLDYGASTKATIMRLGFMEMIKFVQLFYPGTHEKTFLQSSGVADLVATCYGGRNYMISKAFAQSQGKTIAQLEKELLNGQHLQGPTTAAEVNAILKQRGIENQFPLFTAVHKLCIGQQAPSALTCLLKNHPEFSLNYFSQKESAGSGKYFDQN